MNKIFYAFLLAFTFTAVLHLLKTTNERGRRSGCYRVKKRNNLQDTAITITAISSEDLKLKQLENFEDLQFAVPTLTFAKGPIQVQVFT